MYPAAYSLSAAEDTTTSMMPLQHRIGPFNMSVSLLLPKKKKTPLLDLPSFSVRYEASE
jgi:hypothetical protein